MAKLAKVEVLPPAQAAIERRLDDLLVFDARNVDVADRKELLRMLPRLFYLRQAWHALYNERGCIGCHDSDRPTAPSETVIAIAARLSRLGYTWEKMAEIVGLDYVAMSRKEQQKFRDAVNWKLKHPNPPPRRKVPLPAYSAGGLCYLCYQRIRRELAEELGKMNEGRDATGETAALSRRYDLAQWLLNGAE